jgi:beta-phosphoglucomutase-like phosphatase (HAD superfamily)
MSSHKNLARKNPTAPAILFDWDGTLLDTVHDPVTAWSTAVASAGIVVPKWKIHRRIGMSGKPWSANCFARWKTLAKSPMDQH